MHSTIQSLLVEIFIASLAITSIGILIACMIVGAVENERNDE